MKNKLTKLILLSAILTFLLALTGCGEEEELYFEVNRENIQKYSQTLIEKYYNTSEKEQAYYLSDAPDFQRTAVAGFNAAESTDHVGNFVSFADGDGSFEIKNGVDGKILCSQLCKYQNRDVEVIIAYKQNTKYELDKKQAYDDLTAQAQQYGMTIEQFIPQMFGSYPELDMTSVDAFLDDYLSLGSGEYPYEPVECEVSPVYSKSELMSRAGKNTAIGMGVVFAVLIFISFVISLLKYLPLLFDADIRRASAQKKEEQKQAQKATEKLIIAANAPEAVAEEKEEIPAFKKDADSDLMNDAELVAVITAAIAAASEGAVRGPAYTASNDKLVVRSIRRARK